MISNLVDSLFISVKQKKKSKKNRAFSFTLSKAKVANTLANSLFMLQTLANHSLVKIGLHNNMIFYEEGLGAIRKVGSDLFLKTQKVSQYDPKKGGEIGF